MGQLLRKGNEVWFEYVIPHKQTLKDKLKSTGIRFHIEKD